MKYNVILRLSIKNYLLFCSADHLSWNGMLVGTFFHVPECTGSEQNT